MKTIIATIAAMAAVCSCCMNRIPESFEATGHSDAKWKLVFEENFDGDAVNTDVWSIYDGPGHAGHGLRSPEAFTVEDGNLVITAEMKDSLVVSGGMAHKENYLYNTRWEFRVKCDEDPYEAMSGVVLTYGPDNSQEHTAYDVDASQWQNMALEWFEDVIYVYLNGEKVWTVTDREVIPDWPHHICLQLDAFKHDMQGTVKMYVDYVRIYQCNPKTRKDI